MYRQDPVTNHDAMVDAISTAYSMTHGLYSEWSWYGQMQLWDMMKERELTDPTSWIGAYSEIMDEKWQYIIDGFADCPVVQVSNPRAGAYVWFVFQEPYLGLQDSFIASWFRDVLGVRTTVSIVDLCRPGSLLLVVAWTHTPFLGSDLQLGIPRSGPCGFLRPWILDHRLCASPTLPRCQRVQGSLASRQDCVFQRWYVDR